MHSNQSRYSRWSWIIALLLTAILLWMFMTGKGPSNACCTPIAEPPIVTDTMPVEEEPLVVTEAFSFSATADEFVSHGDVSNIHWFDNLDALNALLAGGFKIEGDDSVTILTGAAESEEVKQQKGLDSQSFFGADVTIDNQILVAMVDPAMQALPAVAKVYFGSGFHRLPVDGLATLEPTITWLSSHPDAKATVSGYHDQTGDLISNQELAKKRAQSTYDALLNAGIDASRIKMRKPVSSEGNGDLSEARRVEVSIE